MDILLINVARIGDTLLMTPVLKAIKQAYPHNRLGCLAHPRRVALLQGLHFIDALGSITPKNQWWRARLSFRRPWDAALVYGNEPALLGYAARVARQVVAFQQQKPVSNHLLSHVVPLPVGPTHAVAERMLLAEALGIHGTDHALAYQVLPAESQIARNWLATHEPASSGPLVGLQFSSFPGKFYRDWPLEHFVALGEKLIANFPHARFFTLGDKKNRAREKQFLAHFPRHTVPTSGQFSLRASAAIMQHLDVYIGVDTGPTHLAGALGIPMVALYHCRFPGDLLAPIGHNHLKLLKHPYPDAECSKESPMRAITVETVWAAVQDVLAETGWSRP